MEPLNMSDEDAMDMILRYYLDNHQKKNIYIGDISDELNLHFFQVKKIVDGLIEDGIIGVNEKCSGGWAGIIDLIGGG